MLPVVIRRLLRACLALGTMIVAMAAARGAGAEAVAAWTFQDEAGTALAAVKGQPAALRWSADVQGVTTTGEGALRIASDGEGMAFVPLKGLVKPDETLWVVVRLASWSLLGKGEQVRIGFTHNANNRRAPVAVQMRLAHSRRGLQLAGEAYKSTEGATLVPNIRLGDEIGGEEKITIALEFIRSRQRYNIYRHEGGDNFRLLGSGTTSPKRQANYLRLHLRGDFAQAEGGHLDIGSIVLMAAPPPAQ